jgi:hypothetical protein
MVVVCGCFGYFFYFFTGVAGFGGVSRAVARMILNWRIRDFLCLYTRPQEVRKDTVRIFKIFV